MLKDYAKRKNYQSRPQRRKLILIPIAITIASLFSLTFYYLKLRHLPHHKKTTRTLPVLPQPAASTPSLPQFDFYTLLPKMQVAVPKTGSGQKQRTTADGA